MVNRTALLALSLVVVLAAPGCGGGDGEKPSTGEGGVESASGTFEGDGFSFSYPSYAWAELEARPFGHEVTPEVALGLEQPGENISSLNLMAVTVGMAAQPIAKKDLPLVKPEVKSLFRQIAEGLGGRVTTQPAETTLAGLPGFDGEISGIVSGRPIRMRMVFAWDGRTQYQINCQYTQSHAEEMNSGCDQVLESFQVE